MAARGKSPPTIISRPWKVLNLRRDRAQKCYKQSQQVMLTVSGSELDALRASAAVVESLKLQESSDHKIHFLSEERRPADNDLGGFKGCRDNISAAAVSALLRTACSEDPSLMSRVKLSDLPDIKRGRDNVISDVSQEASHIPR